MSRKPVKTKKKRVLTPGNARKPRSPNKTKAVTVSAPVTEIPKKSSRLTYGEPIAKAVLAMISSGMSLRQIGRRKRMPKPVTILGWVHRYPDFAVRYAHARELNLAQVAEETMEISDDATNDWMEKYNKDGESTGWQLNGEAVARSRLRVDTRKWLLAKLLANKFGDKNTTEHTGKGGGPIEINATADKMSMARWIAFELATAAGASESEVMH